MKLLLALAVLALPACAQRRWIFPALFWGPDQWVSLKLTNHSSAFKLARVDAYVRNGRRTKLEPLHRIAPGATLEVRLDSQSSGVERENWSWAKIEELPLEPGTPPESGLEVTASVEMLRGDEITSFNVPTKNPARFIRWVQLTRRASGQDLYFLNAAGTPTDLTFCVTDDARRSSCSLKDRIVARAKLKPYETLAVTLGKLPKQYLILFSSVEGEAIFGLLRAQKGSKRVFSSESSVSFEEK